MPSVVAILSLKDRPESSVYSLSVRPLMQTRSLPGQSGPLIDTIF